MNVLVKNVTGSQQQKAFLHVESGVLALDDGEFSHIQYEKTMGKSISVIKEENKEVSSTEQSKARPKSKSKTN
jgi:hypothetical protein